MLNRLAAILTTEDLVELNRQVDIERRDPRKVAAEYLRATGLVAQRPEPPGTARIGGSSAT